MVASSLTPSLLVLCETWLNGNITDKEIEIPDYDSTRCDRLDGRRGGGVCVYVNHNTRYEEMLVRTQRPTCIESVCLRLCNPNIFLMAAYIPPNLTSNDYKAITDYFIDCYDEVTGLHPDSYLMIVGDLNQFPTNAIENYLNLTQVVNSPTRGKSTLDKILLDFRLLHLLENSILDKPCTDVPPLISVYPSIGNSDHFCVFMNSMNLGDQPYYTRKVYDSC